AEALAEAMLVLARLRRGSSTKLDVAGWLLAAKPWLSEHLGAAATLTLEVPPEPVMATVHPESLRGAVRAIAGNATAAIDGHGRVTIVLTSGSAPGTFSLSVADDGTGMSAEVAARAREPFFTTRPPAVGIGLTLAELFAREHGGTLQISSTPASGTTVSLHLPLADAT
ncbi:MAG: ATP-binding protein, partial [Acetobacteraceae bacterium]